MAGEKWSLSFPQQIFSTQKLVKVSRNERLRENIHLGPTYNFSYILPSKVNQST
jgi:hypothetical protein